MEIKNKQFSNVKNKHDCQGKSLMNAKTIINANNKQINESKNKNECQEQAVSWKLETGIFVKNNNYWILKTRKTAKKN